MSKNLLEAAIGRALHVSGMAGAMALGITGVAQAQNAAPAKNQPQTLQTIVVTGSHIRRVDLETSNPVVAVTAQQIAATGKLTMGDVIQNLPAVAGGVENPSVNNGGGSGSTNIGLRGLGGSRTLVLVDGQRMPTIQSVADLNFIPIAAVERVEVLTDGASAVYGSDAIGGVVDIILKSNYQGAQFQASYGISDHDDAERKGGSFMFGQTSDKGSILAGVSYQKFDEVESSQRKFSQNAVSLSSTSHGGVVPSIGGSSYAARDKIVVPQSIAACGTNGAFSLNQSAANAGTSPTTLADYHCFGQTDKYNYASVNLILTPQERTNAFFKGVYHLTDNVDAYATLIEQKSTANFQLAPQVAGVPTGMVIAANNPFNPFGYAFSQASGNDFRVRLFPAGNRQQKTAATKDMIVVGLRGNLDLFGQNWTWDLGYNYGHISRTVTTSGVANLAQINADVAAGTLDPFNMFNANTQAAVRAAETPAINNQYYLDRIYHADVSGGLFDLPAGTVQLAGGVSHTTQYTHTLVDPALQESPVTLTCPLGTLCSASLQGGYSVKEAYAELYVPILKDMPFVKVLNVTLGDRYSKYNDVGSTNNWKAAVEYRPIDDLLLRGTVTSVFRAPTVANIYGAPVSSAPFLSFDPCSFNAPTPTTPNPNAGNPACKGVPATGTFQNSNVTAHQQLTAVVSGAQFDGIHLKPESGKTFDFGAVYSPHFIPGLSVSADFWRVYLNDTITVVSPQTELLLCFYGQTQYCPYLPRFTSGSTQGQFQTVTLLTQNLGRVDVKGVDLQANYKLPQFSFGQFDINLNATYLTQFKLQTAPGEAGNLTINGQGHMGTFGSLLGSTCVAAGGLCFYPRIRATATLGWQLGPWDATWTMRYISKFKGGSADPSQYSTMVAGIPGYVIRYGATVYNNLQVGYNIEPINTRIDVGVDNVFDKQPPILYANNSLNANTDPADFDMIGRYYFGRITVSF